MYRLATMHSSDSSTDKQTGDAISGSTNTLGQLSLLSLWGR